MSVEWDTLSNNLSLNGTKQAFMCGPCAVESRSQLEETAILLREYGVKVMRGGAYKPRSSPDSFQGTGRTGLEWLADVAQQYGLLTVSEVLDADDLPFFEDTIDILQIGTRNMQNFALLKKAGQTGKPVLLKRGFMSTVEEFLFAAEYVRRERGSTVILCERGIRTFERWTRNTLDLSCVALVQSMTDYPIIVDLTHSLGRTDIVAPMARAALACGVDGIMLEMHPNPLDALCDGQESLSFEEFRNLMRELTPLINHLNAENMLQPETAQVV